MPPTKKLIFKCSVENYLQIFSAVGANNHRHNWLVKIDFWMGQQIATYKKEDPLDYRVRPISINILNSLKVSFQCGSPKQKTIRDLAWIGFFFILRPGEYFKGGVDPPPPPLLHPG